MEASLSGWYEGGCPFGLRSAYRERLSGRACPRKSNSVNKPHSPPRHKVNMLMIQFYILSLRTAMVHPSPRDLAHIITVSVQIRTQPTT